jgi:mannose-1-phosphate guanylyltransferase/mannose-6-phosphate isomerase
LIQDADDALRELTGRFSAWLTEAALPLWWEKGADHLRGGFFEALGQEGLPRALPRRARCQVRQSYVYALAGAMGWSGPWQQAAFHGLAYLVAKYRRADGQFSTLISDDGVILDERALLYDQAFTLLAMAQIYKIMPWRTDLKAAAHAQRNILVATRWHPGGGFSETGETPFLSNPHMHLFEAALAGCEAEPGGLWQGLAEDMAALALTRFIDSEGGFVREYFDPDWRPLAGELGCVVEPGHQFEWAWLLERWGLMRGQEAPRNAARKLYEAGIRGIDRQRGVAVDEMSPAFAITRHGARLWPQTEWLKAACILAESATGSARARYAADAIMAANALWRFLQVPVAGLWRDKMTADGSFIDEPSPASSLYHIVCGVAALQQLQGLSRCPEMQSRRVSAGAASGESV